jgi:hypothetical protein
MDQPDVFSRRIRWLAIAVGASVAALFSFLSPLAAVGPVLLPLAAGLQPYLSNLGRKIVKWFVWAWALVSSPGLVTISVLLLNNPPRGQGYVFIIVASLMIVSALLILWLDTELLIDGVGRIRRWRSAPAQEPRPVGLDLWILAIALTSWFGWGLVRTISIYHGPGDLYALVMSIVEVAIVVAFDIYLTWRVVKLRRARSVHAQG